jgi:hypothetical protein
MSETAMRPSGGQQQSRKATWSYVAAVFGGVAAVLLFFVVFGIPSGFESFAHRDDQEWQERNNPTTSTTIYMVIPLDDKAFAQKFQSRLNEALQILERWDQTEGAKWETFSVEVQNAHRGGGGATPSVVRCIGEFGQLVGLWDDIYNGELIDFDMAEVDKFSRGSGEPHNTAYWMRVENNAYDLLTALQNRLKWVGEALLWSVAYGTNFNDADRVYVHSWLMLWTELWYPLAQATNTLDIASSQWHLNVDKAERPYRY